MLERVFSILLCVISMIVFYSANNFDMSYIGDSGLGPDFFPKVVSVILFILSGMILYGNLKKIRKNTKNNMDKNTLIIIVLFAIYIFIMGKIGYLVSTILFALSIISILKKDNIILKIVYSILFPVGLYLLFTYAFKVSLPVGILI